jgi:hypothetical protein
MALISARVARAVDGQRQKTFRQMIRKRFLIWRLPIVTDPAVLRWHSF